MPAPPDTEKQNLLGTAPALRVRVATADDAPDVHRITQHVVAHSPGATADAAPTLSQTRAAIRASAVQDGFLWLVATAAALGLRGYAVVTPYNGMMPGRRSCFGGAALLAVVTPGAAAAADDDAAVKTALVAHALAACRADQGLPYRTVLFEMLFREDQPALRATYDVLVENGFKPAGRLEEVAEKNGLLFDQVLLQRKI